MKKISKSKRQSKDNKYEFPVKTDFVFRIHMKTTERETKIITCFELPSGEQHVRNYGNIPAHILLVPYLGQEFEMYLDGELEGIMLLTKATRSMFEYEKSG
ncbi:hypothetical protein [Paenibacillus donghaensis]|uniref:Uncharacterized protein n=1 Tax=Paenibacillus donghaensis TaxID=414771 RepID=A0A2Z2KHB9_9BACL|nr:hypothetical protein [Paenibacillus donghaensis]ASA22643.1 hypothetical protein B9T62_18725 [Paenibacillus donghaensis]